MRTSASLSAQRVVNSTLGYACVGLVVVAGLCAAATHGWAVEPENSNGWVTGQPGSARTTIVVDDPWWETWAVPPSFFWDGTPPVFSYSGPFTFTSATPVLVSLTDAYTTGDQFRLYDWGVRVGTTHLVPMESIGMGDPDLCFADPRYSSGTFWLPAGSHSVDIEVIPPNSLILGIEVHQGRHGQLPRRLLRQQRRH